ncbi:uncharacterized protein TRIADDRAFT_56870 [Trichoplax adhaerens]|uniref:PurE domain-containing protein n=1 Tax=Trichoplax adhaerens TaxID=10228 RepID=B3RWT5_TRIAD|nr:hypothetical protein TRIADDRAFT_56870 [Trichoplax adhaerens]EDV25182.1 hypothetical protein TRIADDRAFT_56870 [Trichoplax adhaerens]|eukprot:XP_002113072.1 hypothetical protein TRIADDRAFT_56870 [Trichoplax adhaerens]
MSSDTDTCAKKEIKIGRKIIEGKTKVVFAIDDPTSCNLVVLRSKDAITAFDGQRAHEMSFKGKYSTATTCGVFDLLQYCDVPTHYRYHYDENSFVAIFCNMIPLEVVVRRIATGSFLKRHQGVKEGYRFSPLKLEFFYKDDAQHDPLVSIEQILHMKLTAGKVVIGKDEIDIMSKVALATFEILERAWSTLNCNLIDLKVEFGVSASGTLLLADVIDNDSWRLWPSGDKRLQKDKQAYRDLKQVTDQAMEEIRGNYAWVAKKIDQLMKSPSCKVMIIMGSESDREHCMKIATTLREMHIDYQLRVSSAHKSTEELLSILASYESTEIPTVFIAVAGRSNGLGPVMAGNTTIPVINCPPIGHHDDIWSSLTLPSGLGCCTSLNTDGAALMAGQILAISNHLVWGCIRGRRLKRWLHIKKADTNSI